MWSYSLRETKFKCNCDLCFRNMILGKIHFSEMNETDYEIDLDVIRVRLCSNHVKELHTLLGVILKAEQEEKEYEI